MKNQLFALKSDDQKRRKLRAVLKARAEGGLDSETLDSIVLGVSPDRQYSISLIRRAVRLKSPDDKKERNHALHICINAEGEVSK